MIADVWAQVGLTKNKTAKSKSKSPGIWSKVHVKAKKAQFRPHLLRLFAALSRVSKFRERKIGQVAPEQTLPSTKQSQEPKEAGSVMLEQNHIF